MVVSLRHLQQKVLLLEYPPQVGGLGRGKRTERSKKGVIPPGNDRFKCRSRLRPIDK